MPRALPASLMEKSVSLNDAAVATSTIDKVDRAGATASFLCAIHCALMPFVVTLLPVFGLSFLSSEPIEWALLAASATLGTLSLCLGYREHRSRRVFAVLGIALALLLMGRLHGGEHSHAANHADQAAHLPSMNVIFMVLGGLAMMGAHLFNNALCRACRRCASHGCK